MLLFPPFQLKTTQCTSCNGFLNTFIIKESFQGVKASKWNTNGPSLQYFPMVWLCTKKYARGVHPLNIFFVFVMNSIFSLKKNLKGTKSLIITVKQTLFSQHRSPHCHSLRRKTQTNLFRLRSISRKDLSFPSKELKDNYFSNE